jgi:uncharacterized protein YuzE
VIRLLPNTDTLSIASTTMPSLEAERIADDVVVDFGANGNVVALRLILLHQLRLT